MSQFNEEIKNASDSPTSDDGPRYPDGKYIMAVVEHEEKNKFEIPGTDPLDYQQKGLWVTFKICEGEYKGRDFKKYFGLRHPSSKACVRFGLAGLKNLYKAVNFVPADFSGICGKRFVATLESKKNDNNEDYPWSTDITMFEPAPQAQGQSFTETVEQAHNPQQNQQQNQTFNQQTGVPNNVANAFNGQVVNPNDIPF